MKAKLFIFMLVVFALNLMQVHSAFNNKETARNTTDELAKEFLCKSAKNYTRSVRQCISEYNASSASVKEDDRCNFDVIGKSYAGLSSCLESSAQKCRCSDPYKLFDLILRRVIHPELFLGCPVPSDENANRTVVILLIGFSSAITFVATILIHYLVARTE